MRLILLLFAVIFMSFNTADTLDAASDFEALKQLEGNGLGRYTEVMILPMLLI